MVPAGQQSATREHGDRRSAERLWVGLGVMMTVNAGASTWSEADASVLDLSQSGLLVRCDRLPPDACQVQLRFEWQGYGVCLGYGAVVRVSDHGFAARFDRVNWAMQDFLALFAVLGQSQRGQLVAQLEQLQLTLD